MSVFPLYQPQQPCRDSAPIDLTLTPLIADQELLDLLPYWEGAVRITGSVTAWLAEAEAVRLTLRPDASGHTPTASDLVNETREESDADILRSIGLRNPSGDSTI